MPGARATATADRVKILDRPTLRILNERINKTLEPLAKELGLDIKTGTGSYTDKNATVKLEIAVKDSKGKAVSKDAVAFKRLARIFGLKASDLGRWFTDARGTRFKIIGLRPRSRTYPILGENAKGKVLKFSVEYVKNGLI